MSADGRIISAGSGFRRVKIEWCGHIYIYSGQPTFFIDLHTSGTFCDHLSKLAGFAEKTLFSKIEQKNLLRATKNFKIFSTCRLGPQVYPKILVCPYHVLPKSYVGSYVGNGRFFRFWNSAGVLVQPWIRIFMSKFEVLLMRWKRYNTMGNTWNYVYFKNM